jgi:hypothetical protein
MDSTATATMQNQTPATSRVHDGRAQVSDAGAAQVVSEGIKRFEGWLDKNGPASFDPYDIWGTRYGLFARRTYYEKGKIGLPFIAPILLLDFVCPSLRSWFVKKDRFGTADGQLATAFLNLYRVTGERKYLDKAIRLGDDMLQYSVSGYSGKCWGYPFDWQNNRGLWKKNTPYITCTPYCFGAFIGLYDATGGQRYLDIARSIATFVYTDLKDTPTSTDAAAASYSPMDATKVVNASAYRAWVLFEADARFNLPEYKAKAQRNLNFILQSQRADGAWLYATEGSGEGFIDNFHTAFVLKNLYRINQRLKNPAVDVAVKKGWEFYRRELFDANGDPKSFAIEPRKQIVKLEMYNFAEGITLGALLKDFIPGAMDFAEGLATKLCTQYQLPDGHFVTRVFKKGFKHTFPFLRWPQAQLFYSLTNLLYASRKGAQQ